MGTSPQLDNEGGDMQQLHPETILPRDEVAEWLKVKPRQVERLGVPCIDLGRKTKRYFSKDVVAWLEAKRIDRQTLHVNRPW